MALILSGPGSISRCRPCSPSVFVAVMQAGLAGGLPLTWGLALEAGGSCFFSSPSFHRFPGGAGMGIQSSVAAVSVPSRPLRVSSGWLLVGHHDILALAPKHVAIRIVRENTRRACSREPRCLRLGRLDGPSALASMGPEVSLPRYQTPHVDRFRSPLSLEG